MPFTLRELLALPALRSRLVSGAAGLDRPVRWAHVCELPDPTEWLGEGDLLMSTGLGIPALPRSSVAMSSDSWRPVWPA